MIGQQEDNNQAARQAGAHSPLTWAARQALTAPTPMMSFVGVFFGGGGGALSCAVAAATAYFITAFEASA